jgi:hypothetical protein
MEFKDIFSIFAVVVSIGSFIIAMLSFNRNKRFENENHLYKIKMEKYHELVIKMSDILLSFDTKLDLADFTLKNQTKENIDSLLEAAEEIDEEVVVFGYYVSSHTLVYPKSIVQYLENFVDYLGDSDIEEGETKKQKGIIENCYGLADKILDAMRKDLNIDELNISLFKRIKK